MCWRNWWAKSWDEHDEVNEEFRLNPDGSYTIDCSANLEDMFDLFSIDEERDYVSVSGWVMEELGRIPVEGDRFTDGRLHVTVTKTDGRARDGDPRCARIVPERG